MPGVRIHHPTLRHAMLVIPTDRPLPQVRHCPQCNENHSMKNYHIVLDGEGNTVVSETVWGRLQEIGTHQFIVMNEVKNPPAVRVGMERTRGRDDVRLVKQVGEALHDLTPQGFRANVSRKK